MIRSGISLQSVILYAIIFLVLIGIPVFLARKSGRNPMDLLFGNRTGTGERGNTGGKSMAGKAAGTPGGPGEAAGTEGKNTSGKGSRPERNSTKQELLETISALLSAGRRHGFYTLAPGTVTSGGKTAALSVIWVTRAEVLGFNCFGYGGRIRANGGTEDWIQRIGGQSKKLESPGKKNREQEQLVKEVLAECGYPEVPVKVYGIFTSASAEITGLKGTGCYRKKEWLELLETGTFDRHGEIPFREIGKALERNVKSGQK